MATYAIQVGHAHRNRGSTGTVGEQTYARAAAEECARRLLALGHTPLVLLADAPVPRCDRFAAIHGDGSVQPSARGASFGYRTAASNAAASRAMGELWQRTYQRLGMGSFRKANYTKNLGEYYGTGKANKAGSRASIIVEGGFLTNPEERAWMTSKAGIDAMAQALVAAFTGREADPVDPTDDVVGPRVLRLTTPQQTGTDVAAWQAQLARWVAFTGREAVTVDGTFGTDTATASARFMQAVMDVATDDPRVGPKTLTAMTVELERLRATPRAIDFEVVAVWRSDHDRALAETTGALLGLRVLREGHAERARRAFLFGAAQHTDTTLYEETRPVAGRTGADTSRANAELIREWIEAGQPKGLRALAFG